MWRFVFIFPMFLFASWAEDTFSKMSLEEKVGQLFVAPACPLREEGHGDDWVKMMADFHIGNALVKQSDSESQVKFLNFLQCSSKLPLMVAADDEWGLAMTMSDAVSFPRNMALGAIQDERLLTKFGKEVGRQARLVGVHLHLAPVADVNNNPKNPIIHLRSFGEDPLRVSDCVNSVVEGMHESKTLACLKHFPGHGDTAVDSHIDLPIIVHDRERLNAVELAPFRSAINRGVDAVMIAHLMVPSIDEKYPTSLSKKCISTLLRGEMGFDGLVITDALNMSALDKYSVEEAAILSKGAGTDLLLYGSHKIEVVDQLIKESIPRAFKALVSAYKNGDLLIEDLDLSVMRILRAKEALGLSDTRGSILYGAPLGSVDFNGEIFCPSSVAEIATNSESLQDRAMRWGEKDAEKNPLDLTAGRIDESLFNSDVLELKEELFQKALTAFGDLSISPPKALYLAIGGSSDHELGKRFGKRLDISVKMTKEERKSLYEAIDEYDQIFVALHNINLKEKNYGLSCELLGVFQKIGERSTLCLFTTPYGYNLIPNAKGKIVAYQEDPAAIRAVLRLLQGEDVAMGVLPICK